MKRMEMPCPAPLKPGRNCKGIVGFDVDWTLANPAQKFIGVLREEHGLEISLDDVDDYSSFGTKVAAAGIPRAECLRMWNLTWERHWREIPPSEQCAREVVAGVPGCGYEAYVVTSNDSRGPVMRWLAMHGILPLVNGAIFTLMKSELELRVYVDDHPGLWERLRPGSVQFMYQRHGRYNRHVQRGPNVVPISSLTEVLPLLRAGPP